MTRILFVLSMLAGAALLPAAHAVEIEGVRIDEKVRLTSGGPELVLNGAGVRTRAFFRVHGGPRYLQNRKTAADAVLADSGPRRIAMHVLRELTSEQLLSAFNDGIADNHTPSQLAPLEARLKEFSAIFNSMKEVRSGDVIAIDYAAPAGTRILVNGEVRGTIAGEDFNRALLRIWLGDKPVDANLKKAMLGG